MRRLNALATLQESGYWRYCATCNLLHKRGVKLSPPVRHKRLAAAARNGMLHKIPGLRLPADFVPPPAEPAMAPANVTGATQSAAAPGAVGNTVRADQPALVPASAVSPGALHPGVAAAQEGDNVGASDSDAEAHGSGLCEGGGHAVHAAPGDEDGPLDCGVAVDSTLACFLY